MLLLAAHQAGSHRVCLSLLTGNPRRSPRRPAHTQRSNRSSVLSTLRLLCASSSGCRPTVTAIRITAGNTTRAAAAAAVGGGVAVGEGVARRGEYGRGLLCRIRGWGSPSLLC